MRPLKPFLRLEEFVNENIKVNEGSVKSFDMAIDELIANVKRGYGWIDPDYTFDALEAIDDEIDWKSFKSIKDEVYSRLIKAGILFYSDDENPEQRGIKVTNLNQLGESEEIDESALSALKSAGDMVLGIVGFKLVTKLTKSIFGTIDLKLTKDPVKLKELAEKVHDRAVYQDKKNASKASLWLNSVKSKIDKGEIKNGLDIFKESTTLDKTDMAKFAYGPKWFDFNYINEDVKGFVDANLLNDVKDLRKGSSVKIDALDYTRRGDNDNITCIRPDGNKMEILKKMLTVKL